MQTPTQTNWTLIAALFVAGLFAAGQFGKLILTLEDVQGLYPDVRAWVPSLISIVGIVGLVFGAVAGPIVARVGLSHILLGSLLVGACMSFVQAMLPPVEWFALTRIIEGFSHLGIVIAGPTLIAAASTDADRPFAMGIWAAFFGASFAITAYFLPGILAQGGLPFLFALHGGGLLVITGVLLKLLPVARSEPMETPKFLAAYRTLYTTPNLLLPGAGFVWYTGLYIALIAVLPLGIPMSTAQIAGIPLVSIAGTVGAGVVAKFLAPHHLSTIGFAATAVLMVVIVMGVTDMIAVYALFLMMGAIPTGAFAAIAYFNDTTTTRAQATGGITHFGNIGTTLGTPLMVLAFQFAGLMGVTIMVVACCAGGIATIVALTKTNP